MTKQNHLVFIPDTRSVFISLASFTTQEPIPLGQLYSRVSEDNGGCFIHPEGFHQSIEGLRNTGLATITEPEPEKETATTGRTTTTVETALTTVQITPQGRELATKHPEWNMNERETAVAASVGGGAARR